MEEAENVQTESSGGDETPEKGLESRPPTSELQAAPEPPPALPPAADAPVTQVTVPELLLTGHACMLPC